MGAFKPIAIVVFVALCSAGELSAQSIRNVPRMSIDELKGLMAANQVVILDVRMPEEFSRGHIPGAENLDYTMVSVHGRRFKDEHRRIVTYCACSNEMTAARAAVDLAALGIPGAMALRGGWEEWVARGEPIEK
jgi:rhodanese-related sulfurtransferase